MLGPVLSGRGHLTTYCQAVRLSARPYRNPPSLSRCYFCLFSSTCSFPRRPEPLTGWEEAAPRFGAPPPRGAVLSGEEAPGSQGTSGSLETLILRDALRPGTFQNHRIPKAGPGSPPRGTHATRQSLQAGEHSQRPARLPASSRGSHQEGSTVSRSLSL